MHDKKLKKTLECIVDVLPEPVKALSPFKPPSYIPTLLAIDPSFTALVGPIDTPKNTFGVFRRYHGVELPTHDPEREVDLAMLSNIPNQTSASDPMACVDPYYPYPNRASFLLGNWYWSGGSQKSQADFKALIEIVGDESFSPADIKDTRWRKINTELSTNDWDKGEWYDEDAG